MQQRDTGYMEKFASELAKLSAEIRLMNDRYCRLMEAFGRERTSRYQAEFERSAKSTPHKEVRDQLIAMAKTPTPYTALRAGNPAGVSSALDMARRGLAVLREEVLSEARNDGRPEYRLAGKGRQTEPLTAFWHLLRQAGFSYTEIAQILPDGRPPDGARERVIDRLKEAKRARAE